jgi:hypothetical protein
MNQASSVTSTSTIAANMPPAAVLPAASMLLTAYIVNRINARDEVPNHGPGSLGYLLRCAPRTNEIGGMAYLNTLADEIEDDPANPRYQ